MDNFKVDLNPLQKQSKYSPYYFSILGIVYIILGIMFIIKDNSIYSSGWIWLIGGIIFLIGAYFQTNFSSNYFIEINDSEIILKQSLSNTKRIVWKNIREIRIKPIAIEFHLNDNSKENVSLGNVGYNNVIEFKQKLNEYASLKRIIHS